MPVKVKGLDEFCGTTPHSVEIADAEVSSITYVEGVLVGML